jgi:hypothetical protein
MQRQKGKSNGDDKSNRNDKSNGNYKATATATTTADPCGMTTKKRDGEGEAGKRQRLLLRVSVW